MSELKILGRIVGTFDGWDGDPGDQVWFYNFKPNENVKIPACECLYYEETEGYIKCGTSDGQITNTFDIIELLSSIPR